MSIKSIPVIRILQTASPSPTSSNRLPSRPPRDGGVPRARIVPGEGQVAANFLPHDVVAEEEHLERDSDAEVDGGEQNDEEPRCLCLGLARVREGMNRGAGIDSQMQGWDICSPPGTTPRGRTLRRQEPSARWARG